MWLKGFCHHLESRSVIKPTSSDTETVCETKKRRWTTGGQGGQQQCNGFRCKSLQTEKNNRFYRWPARRAELRLGEDRSTNHSQGPLCFMQQIHCGEGTLWTLQVTEHRGRLGILVSNCRKFNNMQQIRTPCPLFHVFSPRWLQHWVKCGTLNILCVWCVRWSWAPQASLKERGGRTVTKTTISSFLRSVLIARDPSCRWEGTSLRVAEQGPTCITTTALWWEDI